MAVFLVLVCPRFEHAIGLAPDCQLAEQASQPRSDLARARLDPLSNFVADLSWGPGLWKEVDVFQITFRKEGITRVRQASGRP